MTLTIRPNARAAEILRSKAATLPEGFKRLLPEARLRAFAVAKVADFDALARMREAVAKLPEGGNWREIRKTLAAEISPWLDDAEDADKAARARAELVLRTNGFQAFAAGRYEAQRETADALPYWQYHTVGDGNVRDAHAALDGKVLPADDPFWSDHYPPWDFGCRCFVSAMTKGAAERIRQSESGKPEAERRVVEGKALEAIREGRVRTVDARGVPGLADVRSPEQKEGPSAYRFRPGELRYDPARLRQRWDPATFAVFQRSMEGFSVQKPDGSEVSAWAWLEGEGVL